MATPGPKPHPPPRKLLRLLYQKKHRSIEHIAELLECSSHTVRRYLILYGIPIRPRAEPKVRQLADSVLLRGLRRATVAVLAHRLGVTRQHLTRELARRGIRPRELRRRWPI